MAEWSSVEVRAESKLGGLGGWGGSKTEISACISGRATRPTARAAYRLTIDFAPRTDVISGRASVRRMRSGRSTTKWRPAGPGGAGLGGYTNGTA